MSMNRKKHKQALIIINTMSIINVLDNMQLAHYKKPCNRFFFFQKRLATKHNNLYTQIIRKILLKKHNSYNQSTFKKK